MRSAKHELSRIICYHYATQINISAARNVNLIINNFWTTFSIDNFLTFSQFPNIFIFFPASHHIIKI